MAQVPADIVSRAEQIRVGLQTRSTEIATDRDLTPEARQRLTDEAHKDAKARMDKLRDDWRGGADGATSGVLSEILKAGSYSGTDAISSRDAQDRASRLESHQEGLELMSRAQMSGDEILEGAIVAEAWRRSKTDVFGAAWGQVLNAYAERDSVRAGRVARLKDSARQSNREFDMSTVLTFIL